MLHVRCHVSGVTCHVSGVTCHMSDLFFPGIGVKQVGGGSVITGPTPFSLNTFDERGGPK